MATRIRDTASGSGYFAQEGPRPIEPHQRLWNVLNGGGNQTELHAALFVVQRPKVACRPLEISLPERQLGLVHQSLVLESASLPIGGGLRGRPVGKPIASGPVHV